MREVTVFYAYDDTEFFNRYDCIAYEEEALKKIKIFDSVCKFYNENKNIMFAPASNDIEDWIDWLQCPAGKCCYIRRYAQLPEEVNQFIRAESDYCILNEDFEGGLGLFQYDMLHYEQVKVNE